MNQREAVKLLTEILDRISAVGADLDPHIERLDTFAGELTEGEHPGVNLHTGRIASALECLNEAKAQIEEAHELLDDTIHS